MKPRRPAVVLLLPVLLAGCGDDTQDLRDWIDRERQAAVAPALPPWSAAEAPAPSPYRGHEAPDPFDPQRLTPPAPPPVPVAMAASPALGAAALPPAGAPLEAYPLDALRMVGSLVREGRTLALVRAQGTLHTVQPGDRLGGPHGGRVVRITESAITLHERVRDAQGAWTERSTTLALQETPR